MLHIVGGGIMGLCAAIEFAEVCARFGWRHRIQVYETGAFRGSADDRTAGPLHRDRLLAWPAVKTEIAPSGTHSQAHHAGRVPDLSNAWLALPGKLSQAPICAYELACKILREMVPRHTARPVWETLPAATGEPQVA